MKKEKVFPIPYYPEKSVLLPLEILEKQRAEVKVGNKVIFEL